jgi:hypothetical protein
MTKKTKVSIDPATGMPLVPEDHWWQVSPEHGYRLRVSLFRPGRAGPPIRLAEAWTADATRADVREAAVFALREWHATEARDAAKASLAGCYPPHRLAD